MEGVSYVPQEELKKLSDLLRKEEKKVELLEKEKELLKMELDRAKTEIDKDISGIRNRQYSDAREDLSKSDASISDYLNNRDKGSKRLENSERNNQSVSKAYGKETQGSIKTINQENSYKETINHLENDREAANTQLILLKSEIKEIKKERDDFKKLYDQLRKQSISLASGKPEIVSIIASTMEKILTLEPPIVNDKNREMLKLILKSLTIPEDKISDLLEKKKKKNFFG